MARTRDASKGFHRDDGVLLGKGGVPLSATPGTPVEHRGPIPLDRQGKPISPAAAQLHTPMRIDGDYVGHGPGAEPVAPRRTPVAYRSDRTTWSKLMEAVDLAHLLDLALRDPGKLGQGLVVELTPDEFGKLTGNMRLHFRAVYE